MIENKTVKITDNGLETFLPELLELMQDAFFQLDENWNIVRVNRNQERISQTSREDTIGKNFWQVFPAAADPNSNYWKMYHEVAEKKEARYFEEYYEPLNVWTEVSAYPTGDGGVAVFFRDITYRKLNEAKLIESEQKFKGITNALPHMLWEIEANGTVSYINKQWTDWSGLTLEEINDGGWSKVFHPDDFAEVARGWQQAFESIKTYTGECRIKNPSTNNYSWFLLKTIPIKTEKGKVKLWIGTATNIHDKKMAEKKILENQEQFRTLANSISQLAWMAKADGWIYWYNKRWYDYTGTTLEEMKGWGWEKVHHPDHIERVVDFVKHAWHTHEPFELTFPLKRNDGVYRWFLTRAYPVKNAEGAVIHWIGTNTDIDDHKKAMQLKDEFMSIASHELKTPVTSLKAFTQILQMRFKEEKNEQAADLLDKMDKQVDKLSRLIVDLLDATKIENGEIQFSKQDFDFDELVKEIVEEMQRTTKSHKIVMELSDTKIINGDRNRLGQVITNFISNAIKYSPGADKIIITSYTQADKIKFCIKDFGLGIPATELNNVFDRFVRIAGKKRETFPGLGLGLFIAAEIIKRHNGKIWVESAEEKGSTFCFTLPVNDF